MTTLTTDCEGFYRRDFLQDRRGRPARPEPARPAAARGAGRRDDGRPASRRPTRVILVWLGRRPGDHRHVGPQARRPRGHPRRVQADRHQRRRRPDQRAPAEDGRGRWTRSRVVRSLHHTIPSHGPATVFMTTGNKPTAGAAVPVARLARRQAAAGREGRAAVRHASASSAAAPPASPATSAPAYNPFIVEGAGAGNGRQGRRRRCASAASRCRPASRSTTWRTATSCSQGFDSGFAGARQAGRPGRRARRLPPAGARHPPLRQDEEGVRPRRRRRPSVRDALRHDAVRPGRAGGPPAGRGRRPLRHHQPRRLGHAQPELQRASRPACCRTLDQTLSALIEDLDDRGLLDSTIVYCAGEFGRTPKINKNAGRDHWARSMAVRAGRRRLQARLRPRHAPTPTAWPRRPSRARRTTWPRRSSTTSASTRHRAADPDRPADPALPRGQGGREAAGLSVTFPAGRLRPGRGR